MKNDTLYLFEIGYARNNKYHEGVKILSAIVKNEEINILLDNIDKYSFEIIETKISILGTPITNIQIFNKEDTGEYANTASIEAVREIKIGNNATMMNMLSLVINTRDKLNSLKAGITYNPYMLLNQKG